MIDPVIEAKQLTLRLSDKTIIDNVSFTLEQNKIYGLLGRNGAGKTTLLSLLAGFRNPTSGAITVNGEDVFENRAVVENISFIRDVKMDSDSDRLEDYLKGVALFRPHFDWEYAMTLVERFKLPIDSPMNKLSRGMQSAAHVIIGLASRAPITIFDEAYLGMDAPARDIFYKEVLNEYMERPRTIILSTHLISEVASMLEDVLILHQGSLMLHDRTESLLSRGTTITGDAAAVDGFTREKKVLNEQILGQTKSAMVYGELTKTERSQAERQGLQIGPVALQELFIHLTGEKHNE
ncbi:ABC transporter ATP-binding protein [Bacillus sp. FSL K6-0047]|jgi:ABC-2 type transport system ATP-binding protein|uniref:ATP-binding cassette domain-containing protein n=1 Tax=Shouchella clausii TaxID=79880 RepID=UPI000BA51A4B|nr:ABC transporter ATP-binding protein [Shouchella clausii]PAD47756.1 ABC transporter [Shouchella clausii]